MNSFQILLNNKFTAATTTINSTLQSNGDYLSYVNSNGGGIVNAFNVRGFLNDPRNQTLMSDFVAYLTGNTTQPEAVNILTSDQKLANVFNSYYQNVILSTSTISNTAVIDQSLTGTFATAITEYFHPWVGQSENRQLTGVTESIIGSIFNTRIQGILQEFTEEESYYIPVSLKRNFEQIPRLVYEPCDPIINKETIGFYPQYSAITGPYFENIPSSNNTINSLIQCFVDLNLTVDETTNSGPEIFSMSFEYAAYSTNEGATLQIKVSLSQPSVLGFEEASIILNPFGATLGADFIPLEQYPLILSWAIGEQDKFLTFNISNDYIEEVVEPFILQLVGAINVNIGPISTTTVYIADRTVLNYVGIIRPFVPADNSGITHLVTDEGNDTDFFVQLDNPAYGVEKVVLEQVSVLNTINGNVGPAAMPLNPSEYILQTITPGNPPTTITLPYTISFNAGEISKYFILFAKDNTVLQPDKTAYFQLSNQQFCKIDQPQRMLEVVVTENDGKYKYVHLNFGKIYSEFGDGDTNSVMRMIDPQTNIFNGWPSVYVNQYAQYLIEYGKTITFYNPNDSKVERVSFTAPYVKAKITNLGTAQSFVNGIAINPGQSTTVAIPGNDFILAATTNQNRNSTTDYLDDANYKIEILNTYNATVIVTNTSNQQTANISGFNPFKLMNTDNATQATNKTLDIGTFTFAGYIVNSGDTSYSYHLKSKYLDINTARVEGTSGGVFGIGGTSTGLQCPPVSSFANSISYSEFYATEIENISVFGVIFLGYDPSRMGSWSQFSKYNGFEFVDYTQAINYDCNRTTSKYNGLDYVNLPFILEP